MADVLIVCVREDEPLAKAFADMFERAGLHVGGAPGAPEDMRNCGAALVVWSQASIRSRAFLDAAQRAVNAGKAVVACLIAPPPPASINHAPAFDLSQWTGDPDDPVLDPLFFSVDRMVAAARAAAGVAAPAGASARGAEQHPASYFQPSAGPSSAPQAPPYARARPTAGPAQPVRPPPAPRNPSAYDAAPRMQPPPRRPEPPARARDPRDAHDPVASEAQNWAAIRHSRNAEDFLRHLADYGQDGAFAELAQMKLAELEAEARRRKTSPAAAARQDGLRSNSVRLDPTRPAPGGPRGAPQRPDPRHADMRHDARAPAPREPVRPPPAAFEPIRTDAPRARSAPPQRRPEPPAPTWRDDRGDYRRPPARSAGGGGGIIRLLIIVLLLGGGAVGAGYYASSAGLFPAAETASSDDQWDMPPRSTAESDEPGGIQLDDGAEPASSTVAEVPPARSPQREPPPARGGPIDEPEPEPTRPPERTPPASQPQMVTTTTGGDPAPALPPPQDIVPAPGSQPTPDIELAAVDTPTAPPPAPRVQLRPPQVVWLQRPSAARINELFPSRALRDGRGGRVELDCLVDAGGVPRCAVSRETPSGFGFGSAAVRAAAQFRAAPTLDDGSPSAGAQTPLTIVFRAPGQ